MDTFTRADLQRLLSARVAPCVSLFVPTHRAGAKQDPIRLKNLLRQANDDLKKYGLRTPEANKILAPAQRFLDDSLFWRHQSDGLACFLAPEISHCYRLPISFEETAVVADRFHLKPVLPLFVEDGRFYILAISQNRVRLLQGTSQSVEEMDLKNAPQNLAEALRFDDKEETLQFHTQPSSRGAGKEAIFHGHGVGIDDEKNDLLRYFQGVDRGVQELLRNGRAPLLLASVEYLWPIYRQASKFPFLLERGIAGNPDHLSDRQLHERAWPLVQPYFQEARNRAIALYEQLAETHRAATAIEEVVPAADQGRIETLLVARDQNRWGTYNPETASVTFHAERQPGSEDLLNVAAIHTIGHGGTVFPLPQADVPGKALLAALYWLPVTKRRK